VVSEFDLSAYDYHLPEELIAQQPAEPRDSARLLVVDRSSGKLEHRRFTDLPDYLDAKDLIVANNTRVLKARLLGRRIREDDKHLEPGGKIEFVLLEELKPRVWEGMFHAAAKHRPGVRFEIATPDGQGLRGTLLRGASDSPHGTVIAEFDRDPVESGAGEIPLPKYIRRPQEPTAQDQSDYQTVYAKQPGSAAAPTAGLHFTSHILERLRSRGCEWREVTLHVGLGTFRPVKDKDIRKHVMHEERYEISAETASAVNAAKSGRRRVLAVGTTSVRTLESAWKDGTLRAGPGRTAAFFYPGYQFKAVDRLITNFHLPRSTLLMLVSAFAGRELTLRAYEEAVRERYRFFSYGDAMLVL
jgi:S-adenosylmethionine:tRNA ribosyltransferase-isomerase